MKSRPFPLDSDRKLKPEFLQACLGIVIAKPQLTRSELWDILRRSGWQPINVEISEAIRELKTEGFITYEIVEAYADFGGNIIRHNEIRTRV